MELYEKPWYYTAFHIVLGYFAVDYQFLLWGMILYQFGQLFFNVRVFAVEGVIRQGNSLLHTLLKLSEFGLGYLIRVVLDSHRG